jgi:uncharacterized membrane protein YgcG
MITIKDPGQTLSAAQSDALSAKAAAYPFDIHVLIGTGSGTRAAFEQEVASFVAPGSHTVSIGVDPVHHFSFVRSSGALGVPPGPQVAQAGNSFFKAGNLVDGIDAIAAKANQLKVTPVAAQPFVAGPDQKVYESQSGVPIIIQENHTSSGVWWGTGTFLVIASVIVAYVVWRNKKARKAAEEAEATLATEAAEYASKNIEISRHYDLLEASTKKFSPPTQVSSKVADKSYIPFSAAAAELTKAKYERSYKQAMRSRHIPVAPAPVVINNGGGSSGIDMLIGYELGSLVNRRPEPVREVVRERVVEPEPSSSYSSSSSSDSSSSSSWSSSSDSSSSSSWDSGSSSSFDSGGSSSGSDW